MHCKKEVHVQGSKNSVIVYNKLYNTVQLQRGRKLQWSDWDPQETGRPRANSAGGCRREATRIITDHLVA